jgi:hypothetical protein
MGLGCRCIEVIQERCAMHPEHALPIALSKICSRKRALVNYHGARFVEMPRQVSSAAKKQTQVFR